MANAWTKGPWFAHGKLGKSLQHGVTAGTLYDPSIGAVRRIAKCGSPYPSRTPELDAEDEANAQLIAAAPDMAAALSEWLEFAEDEFSRFDGPCEAKDEDSLCPLCRSHGCIRMKLDGLRSALAKARGE